MVTDKLPLSDADILAYELAFSGQFYDEEKKELVILPFHVVIDRLEGRVLDIKTALNTRLEPIMYLTGKDNFREAIAKKKGYKANRKDAVKPFHLENTKAYILARFNTYTSKGCEADDLICISQMESLKRTGFNKETAETVICTRDKDLRQCMGWHYGWECGKQPEFKLQWIDEIGTLEAIYKEGVTPKGNKSRRFIKLIGSGLKWFYAQVLTGDVVDNIPGLPNFGGAKVYNILDPLTTEEGMLDATIALYRDAYGDSWESEFFEQVHLVWMLRERNDDGSLKWWEYPSGYKP